MKNLTHASFVLALALIANLFGIQQLHAQSPKREKAPSGVRANAELQDYPAITDATAVSDSALVRQIFETAVGLQDAIDNADFDTSLIDIPSGSTISRLTTKNLFVEKKESYHSVGYLITSRNTNVSVSWRHYKEDLAAGLDFAPGEVRIGSKEWSLRLENGQFMFYLSKFPECTEVEKGDLQKFLQELQTAENSSVEELVITIKLLLIKPDYVNPIESIPGETQLMQDSAALSLFLQVQKSTDYVEKNLTFAEVLNGSTGTILRLQRDGVELMKYYDTEASKSSQEEESVYEFRYGGIKVIYVSIGEILIGGVHLIDDNDADTGWNFAKLLNQVEIIKKVPGINAKSMNDFADILRGL